MEEPDSDPELGTYDFLHEVDEYLQACLDDGSAPHVGDLAGWMGVSRATLHREFERRQILPSQYLKQRQIEHAKRLLLITNLPAWAVAQRSGYVENRSFFRAFRRATGVTPSEFRRRETKCP